MVCHKCAKTYTLKTTLSILALKCLICLFFLTLKISPMSISFFSKEGFVFLPLHIVTLIY